MKCVGVSELKARLREYLRQVRRGRTLTVMDRDTPIARMVPYTPESEPLRVRRPLGRYASLQSVPLPRPMEMGVDIVTLLMEERGKV